MKTKPFSEFFDMALAIVLGISLTSDSFANCPTVMAVTVPRDGSSATGSADNSGNPAQVNLKLDFDVMDNRNDEELIASRDRLGPMTVNLRLRVTAERANARDWSDSGHKTISLEYYVRYDDGAWDRIGDHGNITIDKLTKGSTIQETRSYAIPSGNFSRVDFKAKIDTDHEVSESNEADNVSRVESYDYNPNLYADCDLAINTAGLTNGTTTINQGDSFGLFMEVINRGTTPCPYSIRSSYGLKKPGQSGFTVVADDGTDWSQLNPGQTTNEVTRNMPFVATDVGVYSFRACADYLGQEPESNEDNNCLDSTFAVQMYLPDLVIAQLGLTNGRASLTQGDRFGLTALVRNIGPKTGMDTRMAYYLQAPGSGLQYVADDGVGQLAPGQDSTELTLHEPFTASTPGWWQFYAVADYQGARAEMNEGNNGASTWFYVTPAMPDLVVTATWLREGWSFKKDTRVHPYCTVQNIGNGASGPFRLAYYIDWNKYRDDDGVGALCPGCSATENVNNDNIRLGDKGTRTLRCCVDYLGQVPESNEGNNCATVSFTVR